MTKIRIKLFAVLCLWVLLAPTAALAADFVITAPASTVVNEPLSIVVKSSTGVAIVGASVIFSDGGAQFIVPTDVAGSATYTPQIVGSMLVTVFKDGFTSSLTVNVVAAGGGGSVVGDVNGDGTLTSVDALMALQMAAGNIPVDLVADVNSSGTVTSLDALMILQAVVGAITLS